MGFWQSIKGAFGGKPRTPEELFVEEFTHVALAYPGVERVERSPDDPLLMLVWAAGAEAPMQSYLGNIFRETRELSPEARHEKLYGTLSVLDQQKDVSWDDAEQALVPLVRNATMTLQAPVEPLCRPFLPFVKLFVGLDHAQTIQYVNPGELERWGVDAARVFEAANAVLSGHVLESDIESFDPEASYRIWHVTRDDSYESSRLALPGFLASFRGKVDGRPIAIVPERSSFIVSGDGNLDAIARLGRHAEKEFEAATRSLSPAVYTVDDEGRVVPFHLPDDNPHHHLVERGHKILAATAYAEQKEALEKRHDEDGTDIFVASLTLIAQKATGKVTSYTTMAKDVDTLLPEADLIALNSDGGFLVPWAKVFEHAPECFRKDPTPDFPRWRVVAWPTQAALAKIRAASVTNAS